jgi:hypothetical protein
MMAVTNAWIPAGWAVAAAAAGTVAAAATAAAAAVLAAAAAAAVDAVVTLAEGAKMLSGDTFVVEDGAVFPLKALKRLVNGSVDVAGSADRNVGLVALGVDVKALGCRVTGAVLVGSNAAVVCIGILIRRTQWHFVRRS